ncbi:hypothetical protein BVG19_g206 [[Candida] boidinii]|nr:hypothetical protein BVG19_g206 [[Candida] boidinii]OWB49809.1 hypothetical protein B5S27_g1353 [[Candida] boidinii]
MVLYKRKPVEFSPPPKLPPNVNINSIEVWFIKETGEFFLNYDDYLARLDYYNTRKFVCEYTGNSNNTFFEALKEENQELQNVENHFSDALKEPILRFVNFSTVPRLDSLVDEVYAKFKNDFFPGDMVTLKLAENNEKVKGLVREKARFNSIKLPTGETREGYCSYRVFLLENEVEITCNETQLSRDRSTFTKHYVKTFLKLSLMRISNKNGAPWIVKPEFTEKYRLQKEYPKDLKHFEIEYKKKKLSKLKFLQSKINYKNKKLISGGSDSNTNNKSDSNSKLETPQFPNIFESMKETPPMNSTNQAEESLKILNDWRSSWVELLKRCNVYFEENSQVDELIKAKVYKLLRYLNIKILDHFDPTLVNILISTKTFSSKAKYEPTDHFSFVNKYNIKVWHYEKVIRFFKSVGITLRKIHQEERQFEALSIAKSQNGNGNLQAMSNSNSNSMMSLNENMMNNYRPILPNDPNVPNYMFSNSAIKNENFDYSSNQELLSRSSSGMFDNRSMTPQPQQFYQHLQSQQQQQQYQQMQSQQQHQQKYQQQHQQQQNQLQSQNIKKGPIEDLMLSFQISTLKPSFKRIDEVKDISLLLEVWTFLNIYSKALVIDNFTFDDFVTALSWKDDEVFCQLLNEIFCCLIKSYMDDAGNLLVTLPSALNGEGDNGNDEDENGEEDEDEEEEEDEEEVEEEEEDVGNASNEEQGDKPSKGSKLKKSRNSKIINIDDEEEEGEADDEREDEKEVVDIEDENDENGDNESEVEEISHNAYSLLDYKKLNWKERLKRRNFKDGGWQIILIGIFSSIEYISNYRKTIDEVYNCLAPGDYYPTLSTVESNFITEMNIDLRLSCLGILMNLLLNGSVIRNFIDKSFEDSANIKRERNEVIKDLKTFNEDASNIHKSIVEFMKPMDLSVFRAQIEKEEKEKEKEKQNSKSNSTPISSGHSSGGGGRRNAIPSEPTKLEKAVAGGNPELLKLLKSRSEKLSKVDELKLTKKTLENQLDELDCQRVKYIGRDKFYNRYWWFESTGLPNLVPLNKSINDDNDNENEGSGNTDKDTDENRDVNDEEDLLNDTYFMSRLWIQGPGDEDRKVFLDLSNEDLEKWNQYRYATKESEKESEKIPDNEKKKGEENGDDNDEDDDDDVKIVSSKETSNVSSPKKKVIEIKDDEDQDEKEKNKNTDEDSKDTNDSFAKTFVKATGEIFKLDFSSEDGTVKDIETDTILVDKFGAVIDKNFKPIEKKLLEEKSNILLDCHDWGYIDTKEELDNLITSLSDLGEREKSLKKELLSLRAQINFSFVSRQKSLGIGIKSDDEIKLEKIINETVISESEDSSIEEENADELNDIVIISDEEEEESRPRTRRTKAVLNKRKRLVEEENERRAAKRAKRATKPAQRIAKREAKKKKQREHAEKRRLIEDSKKELELLRTSKTISSCSGWVNSLAINEFGASHYEGRPQPVKKASSKKKKSRR